jgi:hypothetical protein
MVTGWQQHPGILLCLASAPLAVTYIFTFLVFVTEMLAVVSDIRMKYAIYKYATYADAVCGIKNEIVIIRVKFSGGP